MKILSWHRTDVGQLRTHNEDSLLVEPAFGLYAVADGMGGHVGGKEASRLALDVLAEGVRSANIVAIENRERAMAKATRNLGPAASSVHDTNPPRGDAGASGSIPVQAAFEDTAPGLPRSPLELLGAATRRASRTIYEKASREPALHGMGTTLTSLWVRGDRIHVSHVGDSRLYLWRGGKIEQVTQDHSWTAEQVKAGKMSEEEAAEHEYRHVITRSVGVEADTVPDTFTRGAMPGDYYLLCSDGLANHVELHELGHIFRETWGCQVPDVLVDLANARGGDDNITVVVVGLANHAD